MRESEAGKGNAGFILTLALFLTGIYVAAKIVPVRVDGYQFREVLREEVRQAAVHRNDEAVVQRILDAAATMDIPLERKNLSLQRNQVAVTISASYEKPVDLTFTTYTYRFSDKQQAPLF